MMDTICPRGHPSLTTDYCDQCGTPIAAPSVAAAGEAEISSVTEVRMADARAERCPACKTPRTPGDRYCEVDGYDFERTSESVVVWCAVVRADRARFELLAPDDLEFPDGSTTLTCELDTESVSVGRQSPSRGIVPDIDLGGPYEDPGVSRRHLRFDRLPDGGYAVVDCGSANGTSINDDPTPIQPETPVPLVEGDRVHLGAWTTITIVGQATGASTA
jgi:FHA domain-containing protein